MSASKDRKKRQSYTGGSAKRNRNELKQEEERRKSRRRYAIFGSLLALFVLFVVVMNSSLFYSVLPAVKVGSTDFNSAEYNYFYVSDFNQLYNNYGGYISYLLDPGIPLDEQQCTISDVGTWADYFEDSAVNDLKELTARYDAAVAAGYTLSEEDRQAIDDYVSSFENYATLYKMSLDRFLTSNFGRGVTEKVVRRLLEMSYVGDDYAQSIYDSKSYTEDDFESYYREHADTYDKISYLSAYVSGVPEKKDADGDGTDDEPSDEEKQAAMDKAREITEAIAAAKDVDEFKALAKEKTDKEAIESTYTVENIPKTYASWLSDKARKEGDTTTVGTDAGYYAIYYLSRDDNHYNTVSVRHILVKPVDEDGDGEIGEEEKAAAQSKIEDIYDKWKSGDATEDSFAELAKEYSEDPGSSAEGGLYENIYKGQMVSEFNDFCFADREPGDTGIVYNENTGYHLIYYVGQGRLYSSILAENALRSADLSAWEDEIFAKYDVRTTFVLRFANKEAESVLQNILSNVSAT